MRVPPTPGASCARCPDWEWHRAGVDNARRRAILRARRGGAPAGSGPASWAATAGRELLRRVPGIGVWTAAEVAQRAWGDPDAVSFGDFHIPTVVGWALLGRPLDDAGMLEVLAPYAPQRQRAVRYIEASGFRRPRFGPAVLPRGLPRDVSHPGRSGRQWPAELCRPRRACGLAVSGRRRVGLG